MPVVPTEYTTAFKPPQRVAAARGAETGDPGVGDAIALQRRSARSGGTKTA